MENGQNVQSYMEHNLEIIRNDPKYVSPRADEAYKTLIDTYGFEAVGYQKLEKAGTTRHNAQSVYYVQGEGKAYICQAWVRKFVDVTDLPFDKATIVAYLLRNEAKLNTIVKEAGLQKVAEAITDKAVPEEYRQTIFGKFAKKKLLEDAASNEKTNTVENNKQVRLIDPTNPKKAIYMVRTADNSFLFSKKRMNEKGLENAFKAVYQKPKKPGLFERISDYFVRRRGGEGTPACCQYRIAKAAYDRKLYQTKLDNGFTPEKPANVKEWEKGRLKVAVLYLFSKSFSVKLDRPLERLNDDAVLERLTANQTVKEYLHRCQEAQILDTNATGTGVLGDDEDLEKAMSSFLKEQHLHTNEPEEEILPDAQKRLNEAGEIRKKYQEKISAIDAANGPKNEQAEQAKESGKTEITQEVGGPNKN